MREIVVISGKGGTGKTSVCAAFAHLARNKVLCDLDVDAPDMHILLAPQIRRHTPFISGNEARIDPGVCQGCGICAEHCRFEAVTRRGDVFVVDPLRCEGCGVCLALCPAQAVAFPEKHCGDWYVSDTRFGPFVHAQLFPGEENSGRLVTLLKQEARLLAKERNLDLLLCDGSPGVGCPVISSLSGAHLAVAVVEPTPSGQHDFRRVADLCDHFRIPLAVLINKADLNADEAKAIAAHCRDKGYTVVGSLPFDPAVTEAMIRRQALTEQPSPLADILADIWERVLELATAPQHRNPIQRNAPAHGPAQA